MPCQRLSSMKKTNLLALGMIFSLVFIASCKKDEPADPVIPNEEEVITTLNYTLTPSGGGTPVVFSFKDLDGDGGNDPVLVEGSLSANTSYSGAIELLNELESPAEDITEEVKDEATDHQFFFQTDVNGLSIDYADNDANNHPIGVETKVSTQAAGTGTLTITLRHQPDKSATGVSTGDISNAGGETDIEVTFNVEIK